MPASRRLLIPFPVCLLMLLTDGGIDLLITHYFVIELSCSRNVMGFECLYSHCIIFILLFSARITDTAIRLLGNLGVVLSCLLDFYDKLQSFHFVATRLWVKSSRHTYYVIFLSRLSLLIFH